MKAQVSKALGEILRDEKAKESLGNALRDAAKPLSQRHSEKVVVDKGGQSYEVTLVSTQTK